MSAVAILTGEQPTMTSREIAELTGKRHDNVMADARKMLVELHGEGGLLSFQDTHRNEQNGQHYKVFKLPKRETLILVSGYSVIMRAKIIDRWQELEQRVAAPVVALPDFTDPVVAARAWADECEAKRAAQLQLEAAAPKVVFADAILNADGTTTVADVARTIKVSVRKMHKALKIKKVILANNAPAAAYVDKGYFVASTYAFETSRGTQIGHSARVTGKGIEFLRRFALRHADLVSTPAKGGGQCPSLFEVH